MHYVFITPNPNNTNLGTINQNSSLPQGALNAKCFQNQHNAQQYYNEVVRKATSKAQSGANQINDLYTIMDTVELQYLAGII